MPSLTKVKILLLVLSMFVYAASMAQSFEFEVTTLPSGWSIYSVPEKFGNKQPLILRNSNSEYKYYEVENGRYQQPLFAPDDILTFLSVQPAYNDMAYVFYVMQGVPGAKIGLRTENGFVNKTPSGAAINNFQFHTKNLLEISRVDDTKQFFWIDQNNDFYPFDFAGTYEEIQYYHQLNEEQHFFKLRKADDTYDIKVAIGDFVTNINLNVLDYVIMGDFKKNGYINTFSKSGTGNAWEVRKRTDIGVSNFNDPLPNVGYSLVPLSQSSTESLVAYFNSTTSGIWRFDNVNLTFGGITPTEGGAKVGSSGFKFPELMGMVGDKPLVKMWGGTHPNYKPLLFLYQGNGQWLYLNDEFDNSNSITDAYNKLKLGDGMLLQTFEPNSPDGIINHYLVANNTILGLNSLLNQKVYQGLAFEKDGKTVFYNYGTDYIYDYFEYNHTVTGLEAFTNITPNGEWGHMTYYSDINHGKIVSIYNRDTDMLVYFALANGSLTMLTSDVAITDAGTAIFKTEDALYFPAITFYWPTTGAITVFKADAGGVNPVATIPGDFIGFSTWDNYKAELAFFAFRTSNYDVALINGSVKQSLSHVPATLHIALNEPTRVIDYIQNSVASLGYELMSSDESILNVSSSMSKQSHTITGLQVGVVTLTAQAMASGVYKPSDSYQIVVSVSKVNQTLINVPAIINLTLGGEGASLANITATSGLAIEWSAASDILTISSSGDITALVAGTTTITVSQIGNDVYNAISSHIEVHIADRLAQTISNLPGAITLTIGGSSFYLGNIVSNSGNEVVFDIANMATVSIVGDSLQALSLGTTTLTAYVLQSGIYAASEVYSVEVTVVDRPTSSKTWSEAAIKIYPNPATDYITIQSQGGGQRAAIYHATGTVVQEVVLLRDLERIDISALPQGVYIVRIGASSFSLVKE